MLTTQSGLRNIHIGVGIGFAILAIALVFFNDASEGVQGAIGMFAFILAFVVCHALDERERRRENHDDGCQPGE
jgi:hypothetical protein